jgi:ADP-heptose:LPS heptosyltransferase
MRSELPKTYSTPEIRIECSEENKFQLIEDLKKLLKENSQDFNDIDGVLDILNACSVFVTTSNTTAHLAGALGKETLLMLPCGNSRFWYWHDIDGVSLWYPSVRVFKQQKRGDWSGSIEAIKSYLEKKFAV